MAMEKRCKHRKFSVIGTSLMWCRKCGALRRGRWDESGALAPTEHWRRPQDGNRKFGTMAV